MVCKKLKMAWWTVYDLLSIFYIAPKAKIANKKKIKGIKEEKISFGEHPDQYLLLVEPEEKVRKNNFIFYLHGGGWKFYSPIGARFAAQYFAQLGYVTISAGYRLVPDYRYPSQIEDTFEGFKSALSIVNNRYSSNKKGIVIGTSAGGHLGGVLFYDQKRQEEYEIDSERIKAFVSHSGGLNLDLCNTLMGKMLIKDFMGKSNDFKNADPIQIIQNMSHIPKKQILCIHGDKDPTWEYEMTETFVDYLSNKIGKEFVELFKAEGKHHNDLSGGLYLNDIKARDRLENWMEELE
ncbi:alpha/beta hydrolase [Natronospora cellulosivora (SeqCode)]